MSEEFSSADEKTRQEIEAAVDMLRPPDVPKEKVIQRSIMVAKSANISRTGVLGVGVYLGQVGPITGIPKAELIELVSRVYDAVQGNPKTAEAAKQYSEMNKEFHSKQVAQEPGDSDLLLPGDGKVH